MCRVLLWIGLFLVVDCGSTIVCMKYCMQLASLEGKPRVAFAAALAVHAILVQVWLIALSVTTSDCWVRVYATKGQTTCLT